MNKRKLKLYMLFILFIGITVILISDTYALFERNAEANGNIDIGKWIININDHEISNGINEDIVIDSFIYEETENIETGYIAPSGTGYADIIIDAEGTDVAIRFDITFDMESADYPENIRLSVSTVDDTEFIMTGPNTYSGVIDLESIDVDQITLRINLIWDDIYTYNVSDTEMGTTYGSTIEVPLNINLKQYLGEEIIPYTEESD